MYHERSWLYIDVIYAAGQSYEIKLRRLKEGNDPDEQLLKVKLFNIVTLIVFNNSCLFELFVCLIMFLLPPSRQCMQMVHFDVKV